MEDLDTLNDIRPTIGGRKVHDFYNFTVVLGSKPSIGVSNVFLRWDIQDIVVVVMAKVGSILVTNRIVGKESHIPIIMAVREVIYFRPIYVFQTVYWHYIVGLIDIYVILININGKLIRSIFHNIVVKGTNITFREDTVEREEAYFPGVEGFKPIVFLGLVIEVGMAVRHAIREGRFRKAGTE